MTKIKPTLLCPPTLSNHKKMYSFQEQLLSDQAIAAIVSAVDCKRLQLPGCSIHRLPTALVRHLYDFLVPSRTLQLSLRVAMDKITNKKFSKWIAGAWLPLSTILGCDYKPPALKVACHYALQMDNKDFSKAICYLLRLVSNYRPGQRYAYSIQFAIQKYWDQPI